MATREENNRALLWIGGLVAAVILLGFIFMGDDVSENDMRNVSPAAGDTATPAPAPATTTP